MKKDTGIVMNGSFVEQHGLKEPYAMDAREGSHGSIGQVAGGSNSIWKCFSAGQEFARHCKAEGLTNRAFRKGRF
jgi:hypothetical protein